MTEVISGRTQSNNICTKKISKDIIWKNITITLKEKLPCDAIFNIINQTFRHQWIFIQIH